MPEKLQEAAELQLQRIDAAVKASLKWPKRFLAMLAVTCGVLLAGTGFTSYLYVNEQVVAQSAHQVAVAIQNDAIQACQESNVRIAADKDNWDFFVDLALKGNTSPGAIAAGNVLKAHVAAADTPRDCAAEFGK